MKNVGLLSFLIVLPLLVNTAHAFTWYVHPDSALNSIQAGLDSCTDNDTVLVGPGTYYENVIWPNTQGIDLIGENGSVSTIIDGGGTARVLQIIIGVDSTTVVKGFTIQNGYHNAAGGGIYCRNSASPIISNNLVTNNIADSTGAGIQCSYSSSPLIDSNTITNNTSHFGGAGIGCYENSNPTIQNNDIHGNFADLGYSGISCANYSSPLITGNMISGNIAGFWCGGIGAFADCAPTITHNTIANNEAMWGAGIGLEGYGVIIGNTITANVADSMGGGIACNTNSSPLIDSNTVSLNSAFRGGGIGVHGLSHPTISNNTISGNTAHSGAGIHCSDYSNPDIFNNIIEDNYASNVGGGIFCIGSSPLIHSCIISSNNVDGVYCEPDYLGNPSNPLISHNNIYNNTGFGVCNVDSTIIVNADSNWWGNATGPCHPTANPGGLGDTVSDYVDFDPWLTVPGVGEQPIVKRMEKRVNIAATIFRGLLQLPVGKECKVFDITGRIVEPDRIAPGVYFVEIDNKVVQKVVKIR